MHDMTAGLFDFIAASPTGFHAVRETARQLSLSGFLPLSEGESWALTPGQGYFVTRNQSSLIAFRMPETVTGFMIGAAHTDSPCFRIKEHAAVYTEGYTKLDVDKYGGMIYSSWLDRPLSMAGRLLVETDSGVASHLFDIDRDLMVIPGLAIHMDRTVNTGKQLSAQIDLMPLLGQGQPDYLKIAAQEADIDPERILSYDLLVYNRTRGTRLGAEGEFILCPRLDDLQCVYSLLQGFLEVNTPKAVPVLALFDSEEVGSQTRQGAMSTFLPDTLRRIALAGGLEELQYKRAIAGSMMVSADNAHGVHPNHPEKAALTNRPRLGQGVVIKYGSGYATSGISAALFRKLLQQDQIPHQSYFNHSDIAGGRTLGQLAITQVPVCTVDIGLAQLSMHSACETAGAADTGYLSHAMAAFFGARITETSDGTYEITR